MRLTDAVQRLEQACLKVAHVYSFVKSNDLPVALEAFRAEARAILSAEAAAPACEWPTCDCALDLSKCAAAPAAQPEPEPVCVQTLRRLDGWLANTGHGEDHPWRISIREALAAATPQPEAVEALKLAEIGLANAKSYECLPWNEQASVAKALDAVRAALAASQATEQPKCPRCNSNGWIEDGDPEIGSASIDCDKCAVTEQPAARAQRDELPPMPATDDLLPYEVHGYLESTNAWSIRNLDAVRWLHDNHAAVRAALQRKGG